MAHLLVWQLSDCNSLILGAQHADLATVTCCDPLSLELLVKDQKHVVQDPLTGCQLKSIRENLNKIVSGTALAVRLFDNLLVGTDQCGQVLVEIRKDSKPFVYSLVTIEIVQSWITQLELLDVVMEENENE